MVNSLISIIVNSCDAFADCWKPFIHSIKKEWSDCPWPVYIISNNKEIDTPEGIKFLKVGEDRKFASNLKKALSSIDSKYIIYLQEDYFLNRKVNQKAIESHIEYCIQHDVDYMRLGMPFIKGDVENTIYSTNKLTDKYALCLQAAIWKKETLESLLFDGWSGWDFEYKIQRYAIENNIDLKILGLNQKYDAKGINYVTGTAVRKGRWTQSGYQYLKDEGFSELTLLRGCEGRVFAYLQTVSGVFNVPSRILVRIMKYFKWNF